MASVRPRLYALLVAVALASALVATVPAGAATTSLTKIFELNTDAYTPTFYDAGATSETFSSPVVGDITGDGQPEIVAGYPDGHVYAWNSSGTRLWRYWTGNGAIHMAPVLADLNGDGVNDVLIGNLRGYLFGLNGSGAKIFSVHDNCNMPSCGFFGTPTVADIDRDGALEVVAGSWDHHIHVWNLDGSYVPGFPVFTYDTHWSGISVADIDADGWLEMVIGGDMDSYPGQPYPTGGLLWVLRHDGSRQPGFPLSLPGQTIWSSPAIADLNGDGALDIIVGTGLNFPDPNGRKVYAVSRTGAALAGWPVTVGGRVMASPSIGDLTGDGRPEVVTMAEDGYVYAHSYNGSLLWKKCNANDTNACPVPLHGSAVIADVDNDGAQEVVSGGEQWLRVFRGSDGVLETQVATVSGTHPLVSPAVVTQVNGQAWILQNSSFGSSNGLPASGRIWVWRSSTALGLAPWPMHKQNVRRSGVVLDVTPPSASISAIADNQSSLRIQVDWSGSDSGTGIATFDVEVDQGAGWVRWMDGKAPSARSGSSASGGFGLYGKQGQAVSIRVRARDFSGNVGAWSATETTSYASNATKTWPFSALYAVNGNGSINAANSQHFNLTEPGPPWPGWDVARGLAVRPAGGGYVLDAFGGIHRFGGAPAIAVSGYWPGWDIMRGIVLNPDGVSGYRMDAWGGLHPFGGAVRVTNGPYWQGWDIARAVVLTPSSTAASPAGYILDGFGGLHRFGAAPALATTGYWSGWDIARSIALNPDGAGGYVLDGWGGLHRFGNASGASGGPFWQGWDIARGAVSVGTAGAPSGYVLDGFGGIHKFGSAPAVESTRYWGFDIANALS